MTQGQRCEGPVPPCAVQGEFRGTNPHLNGNLGDMGAFPLSSSVRVKYIEVNVQLCHHTVGSSASGEKHEHGTDFPTELLGTGAVFYEVHQQQLRSSSEPWAQAVRHSEAQHTLTCRISPWTTKNLPHTAVHMPADTASSRPHRQAQHTSLWLGLLLHVVPVLGICTTQPGTAVSTHSQGEHSAWHTRRTGRFPPSAMHLTDTH